MDDIKKAASIMGKKGGPARAKKYTSAQIAQMARAGWKKHLAKKNPQPPLDSAEK
jgi:hypothetical protein